MKRIVGIILAILFTLYSFMAGYSVADSKIHITSKPMPVALVEEPPTTISTTSNRMKYGIDDSGVAWFEYRKLVGSHRIPIFYSNEEAKPISYDDLLIFLSTTRYERSKLATPGLNDCADYVADLYNRAEISGIESGIVVLFSKDTNHGLNCFRTTDKGIIYIDSIWLYDNEVNPIIDSYYIIGDGNGQDPSKILVEGIGIVW